MLEGLLSRLITPRPDFDDFWYSSRSALGKVACSKFPVFMR
jgi:hypothetical protein